jgi:preprotein translocase subunit SecG
MSTFLAIILILTSLFLILLVLIQRGRGGGLAGAFGGMGGQSAFGAKAGDLFTRVTIGVAAFWIVLCMVSLKVMGNRTNLFSSPGGTTQESGTQGAGEKSTTSDEKLPSGESTKSSEGADKNSHAEGEKADKGPDLGGGPGAPQKNDK